MRGKHCLLACARSATAVSGICVLPGSGQSKTVVQVEGGGGVSGWSTSTTGGTYSKEHTSAGRVSATQSIIGDAGIITLAKLPRF
jgi:hypothetical protein